MGIYAISTFWKQVKLLVVLMCGLQVAFLSPLLQKRPDYLYGLKHYKLKSVDFYLALNLNVSDDLVKRFQSSLDSMKRDGTG
jgi:hypothetical protein